MRCQLLTSLCTFSTGTNDWIGDESLLRCVPLQEPAASYFHSTQLEVLKQLRVGAVSFFCAPQKAFAQLNISKARFSYLVPNPCDIRMTRLFDLQIHLNEK